MAKKSGGKGWVMTPARKAYYASKKKNAGPGAAASRRLSKLGSAMKKAGYTGKKDPFGTPASVKIKRFNKLNKLMRKKK